MLVDELLRAVGPLMRAHPALRVELIVRDRPPSPVADGIDVAIWGGRIADSSLVARKLLTVEILLAAREVLDSLESPERPEEVIAVDQQEELRRRALERVGGEISVELEGRSAVSSLERADFLVLGAGGAATREAAVPEAVESAVLGLTWVYPTAAPAADATISNAAGCRPGPSPFLRKCCAANFLS